MNILNPIKISYKNLLATKFHSFLTILGIIIGVASVIIIFSIGRSAQELILDQIRGIGSNLIAILPGASDEKGPPASVMGVMITTLKYDDLLKIKNKKNTPEIKQVAGYVSGTATVKYQKEIGMPFVGTTASFLDVENTNTIKGRFFTLNEETNLARVAVLGVSAKEKIFNQQNPLGKKIKINGYKFTVIGVLKNRKTSAFGLFNQNESIFIPLFTAQKLLLGINNLALIRVQVDTDNNIPLAKKHLTQILRNQHHIDNPNNDDFSLRDQISAIKILKKITNALRYFLLTTGVISLIIGGVGIMNVMLIAINQRIREIGLRKAVGAKNSDIMFQFLVESATIALLGGFIGVLFGIGISFLISIIITKLGYDWHFLLSMQSILIATFISVFIGLLFGLYPARKASKISPMEALHYE